MLSQTLISKVQIRDAIAATSMPKIAFWLVYFLIDIIYFEILKTRDYIFIYEMNILAILAKAIH